MKLYELTYLISPELSVEEIKAVQEKINTFIQSQGGVLVETGSPMRRNLAYPIKKKEQAYFTTIIFQLSPEKTLELKKELRANSEILRYLLLTKKISKRPETPKRRKREVKPRQKVELKDIEKKLEEILGETEKDNQS